MWQAFTTARARQGANLSRRDHNYDTEKMNHRAEMMDNLTDNHVPLYYPGLVHDYPLARMNSMKVSRVACANTFSHAFPFSFIMILIDERELPSRVAGW